MISFVLSPEHFQLLSEIDFTEMGDSISLDKSTYTVRSDNIRLHYLPYRSNELFL